MSLYDTLRHFADSYALLAMFAAFVVLCAWPFRPGARHRSDEAATMIFKDETDGE
ncbi:cbb3-type cytochrome c oxidase subunit 3 [Altericroceibacterium spongiae]|uniref:Cbb3-type cytochrome c oxidase subunit 3 n=1 Tax=Altericroceibacterium spongiae TaxID=2320269 RepID=A0A420ELX0_9SPHN|nr:cbb3-type cytochrome c oxidase subunit 3 [Altericroceibacterium spongiae]RKF21717.1 cbb3-type cytochrome c oxidase subunit 3 [Altericroceibacterium spongiae]